MKEVASAHSHIVEFIPKIGTSHEGRDIAGLKIVGAAPRKRVMLLSGTHAREWIAEGVSLWAIPSLVEQYDTDPEIKKLIDQLEIFIVPCYNPVSPSPPLFSPLITAITDSRLSFRMGMSMPGPRTGTGGRTGRRTATERTASIRTATGMRTGERADRLTPRARTCTAARACSQSQRPRR